MVVGENLQELPTAVFIRIGSHLLGRYELSKGLMFPISHVLTVRGVNSEKFKE